jgi:hypothetical protein
MNTNWSDRPDRHKLEKIDTSLTQGLENFISTPRIFSDKSWSFNLISSTPLSTIIQKEENRSP